MASTRQIIDFIYENDCSKNHKFFRHIQDKLSHVNSSVNSSPEEIDMKEMRIMKPYYRAALRRNFHEFRLNMHGFKCICATNAPAAEISGLILFFHGLGASPHAFLRVFDNFYALYGASVPIAFVIPQAPLPMHPDELGADGSCSFGSFKWWDIVDPDWISTQWFGRKIRDEDGVVETSEYPVVDCTEVETVVQRPKGASDVPSGLHKLRPLIEGLRQEITNRFGVPYGQVAIAGFSQGSMLAVDSFYQGSSPPLALGIFSGAPMCLKQWNSRFKQWKESGYLEMYQGVPIFQTHGTKDSVLPLKSGRILRRSLRSHGLHHRMALFPGDHFLPDTVINLFSSIVITRLRFLLQRRLSIGLVPLTVPNFAENSEAYESDSVEKKCHKHLGPAPEVVDLLSLEENVVFLGYFSKRPMRHFFGGNSDFSTPEMNIEQPEELDQLRVRRLRRRQRLAAEFGFPDSDEKLCETSDSLQYENDATDSSDCVYEDTKLRPWTCVTRSGANHNRSISGTVPGDLKDDADDDHAKHVITMKRQKNAMRKRLKMQKKSQDAYDDRLTFGNKSGYKISYGFLRCCLPVASHCIE
eukprot:GHVH01013967.1.p1 GENE.GHVH01013967.1~~GHVH01013967.1.p1  ORF type:complete len:583 (+),score=68.00 GHVH01013967.1:34-1782(+)